MEYDIKEKLKELALWAETTTSRESIFEDAFAEIKAALDDDNYDEYQACIRIREVVEGCIKELDALAR